MRSLGFLSVLALFACGVASATGCTTVEEPSKGDNDLADSRSSRNKEDPIQNTNSTSPAPTQTQPPAPTVTQTAPPPPPPPPPPQTDYCAKLTSCCGQITNFYEKAACMANTFAGNQTTCQVQLMTCQGGGIFNSNDCSNLSSCCTTMSNNGDFNEASDCRSTVSQGDSNICKDDLSYYRTWGYCN